MLVGTVAKGVMLGFPVSFTINKELKFLAVPQMRHCWCGSVLYLLHKLEVSVCGSKRRGSCSLCQYELGSWEISCMLSQNMFPTYRYVCFGTSWTSDGIFVFSKNTTCCIYQVCFKRLCYTLNLSISFGVLVSVARHFTADQYDV